MPASELRAEGIAARLSAAGLTPRVEQHARLTSIEAEVPERSPPTRGGRSWKQQRRPTGSGSSPTA